MAAVVIQTKWHRMRRLMRSTVAVSVMFIGLTNGLCADPLPPADCDALRAKHQGLLDSDMAADMKNGPAWAKDNLAPERLEKLDKVVRLEEQLAFRCPPGQAKGNLLVLRSQPKPPGPGKSKPVQKPDSIETGALKSAQPARKPSTIKQRSKKATGRDVYVPPPPGLGYRPSSF